MPRNSTGTSSNGNESAALDAGDADFDIVAQGDYSASFAEAASFDDAREDGFDVIPQLENLFISHGEWMQRTHLTIGVRSAELRKLDTAILRAEQISLDMAFIDEDMELRFNRGFSINRTDEIQAAMAKEAYLNVRNAFQAWVKSENNWRDSRRNKELAASQVYEELRAYQRKYGDPVRDAENREAKSYLDRLLEEQAAQIFRGAKVQRRGADLSNSIQTASQFSTAIIAVNEIRNLDTASKKLIELMVGDSSGNVAAKDPALASELAKLVPSLSTKIHEFCKLIPVAGIVATTVSALCTSYDVYNTKQNRLKLMRVAEALPVADARAALSVIKSWQDRYIHEQSKVAAMEAGTAGMQLLSLLVPVSQPIATIAGAAKSLAELMTLIADLAEQYKQARALEEYLQNSETIGLEIFSKSPLVGAYYVLSASLATFSLHICPYDSPTFQEDTEYLRESGEMKAVLCDAARIIDLSKYVLIKNGIKLRGDECMSFEAWGRFKARKFKNSVRQKAHQAEAWAQLKASQLKARWAS